VPVVVTRQLLWLLGQGIGHSPSAAMQNAALRACGLESWEYALHDVDAAGLEGALAMLRRGEVRGANVTIPHKRAVAAACDVVQGDAAVAGAVNTVLVRDGRLVGENTDALGLERALRSLHLWPQPGAAVVVLGAGGAAAAAVLALGRAQPASIAVAARRSAAAGDLAASAAGPVEPLAWDAREVHRTLDSSDRAVLVNATPAGVDALPVDVALLPDGCIVVDLRYRPRPVDLVAAAQARGLPACDGVEMLLHQGMLSFELWTGMPAPWDAARGALVDALGTGHPGAGHAGGRVPPPRSGRP
jgi:shikimate dehydrogenase